MSLAENAVRLASLHESPGYRAERFDRGDELWGRVAVLPSAFNPPTRAHLALLQVARNEEGITAVAALLSTTNVDKHLFGAPLSHRMGMLLALAERRPWCGVLATNAARLIDQGLALSLAFPDAGFDFVVGYDTLLRIFDNRYYDDMDRALVTFFRRHRVIATNRAEATTAAVYDFLSEPVVRPYAGRVIVRRLDPLHASFSSTAARAAPLEGTGAGEALEPEVRDYILRHGLYGHTGGEAGASPGLR